MKKLTFKGADGNLLNGVDFGGDGQPPVLLIHGGAAHARWWDFVAPALVHSHHVLALDQRGHGDSEWMQEWGYGTRHYVADIGAVIAAWGAGAPIAEICPQPAACSGAANPGDGRALAR